MSQSEGHHARAHRQPPPAAAPPRRCAARAASASHARAAASAQGRQRRTPPRVRVTRVARVRAARGFSRAACVAAAARRDTPQQRRRSAHAHAPSAAPPRARPWRARRAARRRDRSPTPLARAARARVRGVRSGGAGGGVLAAPRAPAAVACRVGEAALTGAAAVRRRARLTRHLSATAPRTTAQLWRRDTIAASKSGYRYTSRLDASMLAPLCCPLAFRLRPPFSVQPRCRPSRPPP
jgi:hypothetical protein